MLCTLQDIKDRLAISDTDYDSMITAIIAGITGIFEGHCQRPLVITAADIVENYTGLSNYLKLNRYPVVSITSIIETWDYSFDETPLTANTDYRLINVGKNGLLYRLYMSWRDLADSIQVTYRGGYTAAGDVPGEGETAIPDALKEAAILQCCFVFKRRDDIGLSAVSFDGAGFQKFSAIKLLPMVSDVLNSYRRITL
jgi:hypothetical protein